jgi:hypothetical protein
MKITKLPIYSEDRSYIFEPYSGLLVKKKHNDILNFEINLCNKVSIALKINNNPYTVQKIKDYQNSEINNSHKINRLYVNLLIKTCKISFFFARILAKFRLPIYDNSTEAIIAFRKIAPLSLQNDLCLPRALYAAITSKKFKEKGVVFIGVFLPSNSMHAWVIEDGVQPDPYDAMWINFQPVAAIW